MRFRSLRAPAWRQPLGTLGRQERLPTTAGTRWSGPGVKSLWKQKQRWLLCSAEAPHGGSLGCSPFDTCLTLRSSFKEMDALQWALEL